MLYTTIKLLVPWHQDVLLSSRAHTKKMKRNCKRLDHREGEKERKETFLLPIRFSSKRALPFAMECSVQPETAACSSYYYYCEVHFSKEKNNGALQLYTTKVLKKM